MFKLTFAHKLAMTMTALVLLAALVIGYPMVHRLFSMLEEQFNTIGTSLASQVAVNAVEPIFVSAEFDIQRVISSFEDQPESMAIVLVNRDGETFGTLGTRPPEALLYDEQYYKASGVWVDSNNVAWFHHPIQFNNVVGGVAWVGINKRPLIANQNIIVSSALTVVALMVLTIIWLAVRLSRNLSRPINELIDAAQAIDSGQYNYRIRSSGKGEFAGVKEAFNNMANNLEEKLTLERNISRFVSPGVAHHYMSKDDSELTLQGERVEASIMFVDLVGYTAFSEQHSPETVADVLNFYFSEISDVCHQFQGNVDKFIGDCAMLVFGCPYSDELHREHALECALNIRNRIHDLNAQRRIEQKPWLDIRIGLAGGTVLAGLLGSRERLNYSVIGEAANLAARLCDKAPSGEILTDREFLKSLGPRSDLRTHETQRLSVKGFSQPVDTHVVEDLTVHLPQTKPL